jgi:hypothetical protein
MPTTRGDRFATKQNWRACAGSQYRRLMKMCGYVPIAVDMCKPTAVMHAAGRYRYHAQWRVVRDGAKFGANAAFGAACPALRRRLRADPRGP